MPRKINAALLSLLVLLSVPNTVLARGNESDESTVTLRIGVREHAKPFSYRIEEAQTVDNVSTGSGPLRANGFEGYMVHICDSVLKEMAVYHPRAPSFDASQQVEVISIENSLEAYELHDIDRFNLLSGLDTDANVTGKNVGNQIDILCDPATISSDRVRQFAVSAPVFASGVGYLTLRGKPSARTICQPNHALIGVTGATNAIDHGINSILRSGELKRYKDKIVSAMREKVQVSRGCNSGGENVAPSDADSDNSQPNGVIWVGANHQKVAEQFCEGNISYYVGDFEIISEHARDIPGCEWIRSAHTFTDDRYAVFANIQYNSDPVRAKLINRFFEVLNREIATSSSVVDQAYASTFGIKKKSRQLNLFYWALRGPP